jgi:hypothetical protein
MAVVMFNDVEALMKGQLDFKKPPDKSAPVKAPASGSDTNITAPAAPPQRQLQRALISPFKKLPHQSMPTLPQPNRR